MTNNGIRATLLTIIAGALIWAIIINHFIDSSDKPHDPCKEYNLTTKTKIVNLKSSKRKAERYIKYICVKGE